MNISLENMSNPSKPSSNKLAHASNVFRYPQDSSFDLCSTPDVQNNYSSPFSKFSNQTAGVNFIIESSLLSNLSDRSRFLSGSVTSGSSVRYSSDSDRFPSDSSRYNTGSSVSSISDVELRTRSKSKKANSKNSLKCVKGHGKVRRERRRSKKQKTKRSEIIAEALSQKYDSSATDDESILDLVDDIITSQVPKKKTGDRKFKKEDTENLLSEEVSKENEVSILDLVDEVISSTQETNVLKKPRKTKKLKNKKPKTSSLQNVDMNTLSLS